MGLVRQHLLRTNHLVAELLHHQMMDGEVVKSILMSSAHEEVRQLLDECMIITDLLTYGQSSRKFRNEDGESYGYTSRTHLIRMMRRLKAAWNDEVEVKIDCVEPHRIEVTFTVIG